MKNSAISLKIGEETFTLEGLSMGALLDVMEFNERMESGEMSLEYLSTREGMIEFLDFIVVLFEDPNLDREKLKKAEVKTLLEAVGLEKINAWIENVMPGGDEQSESKSAEKKGPPQLKTVKSQS